MAKVDLLDGVKVFYHDSYKDHRGELYTIWTKQEIPDLDFNHDKIAISSNKVLRGLHTDKSWKLISCIYGKIQLVVVNYNSKSSDYLNYMSIILDSKSDSKISVLVPPTYLNGHLILSDEAIFHYKWAYEGDYPDVKDQISINWAEPKIGINWLVDDPILSERDKNSKLL